jgi:hypothetical protein
MKTSFLTLAALSLAQVTNGLPFLPRRQVSTSDSATLVIHFGGGGDASTTLTLSLERTQITNFFNRNSVLTTLNQAGVFCGGFQDAEASILIGTIFDSTHPAVYAANQNAQPEDAVMIESYWCSKNKMAVERRAKGVISPTPVVSSPSTNPPTVGNSDQVKSPSINSPTEFGHGSSLKRASAMVQIEKASDQFSGARIPLDEIMTKEQIPEIGSTIIDLDIVKGVDGADDSVLECAVFEDAAATIRLGAPATVERASQISATRFQPVNFGSILCKNGPIVSAVGTAPQTPGSNNGNGVQGSVSLQIETDNDEFRGTEVPVNRLITVAEDSQLVGRALRIDVVGGDGNIQDSNIRCQAWLDEAGQRPIGREATVAVAAELSSRAAGPVAFKSVTCTA